MFRVLVRLQKKCLPDRGLASTMRQLRWRFRSCDSWEMRLRCFWGSPSVRSSFLLVLTQIRGACNILSCRSIVSDQTFSISPFVLEFLSASKGMFCILPPMGHRSIFRSHDEACPRLREPCGVKGKSRRKLFARNVITTSTANNKCINVIKYQMNRRRDIWLSDITCK